MKSFQRCRTFRVSTGRRQGLCLPTEHCGGVRLSPRGHPGGMALSGGTLRLHPAPARGELDPALKPGGPRRPLGALERLTPSGGVAGATGGSPILTCGTALLWGALCFRNSLSEPSPPALVSIACQLAEQKSLQLCEVFSPHGLEEGW